MAAQWVKGLEQAQGPEWKSQHPRVEPGTETHTLVPQYCRARNRPAAAFQRPH